MHINPQPTLRPVPARRASNSDPKQPHSEGDFADKMQASMQDQRRRQSKKHNKAVPMEAKDECSPGKSGIIDTSA